MLLRSWFGAFPACYCALNVRLFTVFGDYIFLDLDQI